MATITGIKVGSTNITATYGSLTSNTVVLSVTALNLGTVGTISGLSNQTYTGSAIKLNPTVTVTATGVGTDVPLAKDTDYTVSWSSSVDSTSCIAVGTVTVTVTGKGNYTGSKTATYNITGATITVKTSGQSSLINQTYTYNGSAQGVGIVATTTNSQTATIRYRTASSGEYNLTSAPQITNVSQSPLTVYYQVTAPNHADKTGSYTITINPAGITIPTPTGITKTYDGSAYSASFGSVTGASITKYRYNTSGATSSWTETTTLPSRTSVGTTTVQAYYTADGNHNGSGWSSTASIVINAADFTVTANNQSFTWTGNAQGNAISVTNLKGSQTATIKYGTTSGTYDLTSAPKITNVSQSPLTVYWQVTASNHNTQTGSYTITINPAGITIPTPTSNEHIYTGTTYYATFPAASYATITNYRYSTTDGSGWSTSNTNPGNSTVRTLYVQAYYTADGNHSGSGWSSSATITVTNATITVTANNQSYTYNGSAQGAAISASTVNSQTATIKYGTTSGTYDLTSAPKITNVADSKTIYYQVTAPNHADKTGSYTLTITPATPTFSLTGSTKTYHEGSADIKATASVAGTVHWGTTSSAMTSTKSISANTATTVTSRTESNGVGTTTIYAYFIPTDNSNYNSVGSSSQYAQSAAAKINASGDNDITVSVEGTLYYTGSAQVIATMTDREGVAHFTLGYSTTSNGTVTWGTQDATTISATNPGTYYIHYKLTPDSNHSTTIENKQIDATSTINNGTLTITVTGYSATYDGSAHNIVASGPSAKNQANQTVTGVTYTYSTSENGTYGSMPTRTAATGTSANESATVTYWVKADMDGYTTAKKSFTVYIARAANPLTISPTTATIYNTTGYNTVQITPSGAQGSVSYSSSATGKATVNSSGLVTYVAAGTATITVTAAGNDNYKSGSKTCAVTTVVDTVTSYGDITGTITITQKANFPAGGVTLTTSNISTYFNYTSTAAQTKTWASGNTTSGTITHTWSGTNVSIPSLGTSETSTVTSRNISFTVTASGEGSKTKSASVSTGNQEANPVTGITLSLVTAGDSTNTPKTSVAFGSSLNTRLVATYKSGSTGVVSPKTVTSSDTTVATVS